MRCILCEKLSFKGICGKCAKKLLSEQKHTRILEGGLKVYSFFGYSGITPILHVKHRFWGHRILKQIASYTFGKFAKEFEFGEKVAAVGVDDKSNGAYSHTAVLAHALKSPSITPVYGVLRAKNAVTYSGQSYEFRRKNPRRFIISKKIKKFKYAILIDDVVTSGFTLREAKDTLAKEGVETLFALVLADAKE